MTTPHLIRSMRELAFPGPGAGSLIWPPCPALSAKIFRFHFNPNHLHILRRLVPHEGRLAIVTDAGRDAVDAGCAFDEMRWLADGEVVWS
jgi:hypothetical protein